MAVIDAFSFYNELDLLEVRIRELMGVVDKFVIVEATTSYRGFPKQLSFLRNRERYEAIVPGRIIHVIVDDMPSADVSPWLPENFQRECIMRGLTDAKPDDTILISDLDEIPSSKIPLTYNDTVTLVQILTWGKLNACCTTREPSWTGTVSVKFSVLKTQTPQWFRNNRSGFRKVNSGWHFSYSGPLDRIHEKVHNFAHTECDTPQYHKQVDDTWQSMKDNPPVLLLPSELPSCVFEDVEKFKSLLAIPSVPTVVSVIIPSFRNVKRSIEACKRFYDATNGYNTKVECIIVDRYGQIPDATEVPDFVKLHWIDKETPVEAINYGYSVSTGDFVMCALDNTVLQKGWFDAVLRGKSGVFTFGDYFVATRTYLEGRNGNVLFYPEYKCYFCNIEFLERAKVSGDIVELSSSLVTRIQDNGFEQALNENGQYSSHDSELYNRRKSAGYPALRLGNNPQLSILMASMFRKEQMLEVIQRFRDTLKDIKYEFIIYIEEGRESYEAIKDMPNVTALWGETQTTPIRCTNECLKLAKGDFIMSASDDTFPERGWYEAVMTAFDKLPNRSGLVGVNDMHRDGNGLSTIFVMSRDFVINEMGGVFVPPCYNAYYSDPEVNEVAKAKGKFIWAKDAHMEHRHHGFGYPMDDLYQRNMRFIADDTATYLNRKARGYPIEWEPIITK